MTYSDRKITIKGTGRTGNLFTFWLEPYITTEDRHTAIKTGEVLSLGKYLFEEE